MTLKCETELLRSVAEAVATALSLESHQVTVELDDEVPAIAGDKHVTVVPAGVDPGPTQGTNGGAFDLIVGVRVCVFHRTTSVPRDRRRSFILDRSKGLNEDIDKVIYALDFKYTITSAANNELDLPETTGFIKPLVVFGIDRKPEAVFKEPYDAAMMGTKGDPIVAIKRGVNFGGARFMLGRDE